MKNSAGSFLAWVASVSVWFRSKERPRNGILGFGRATNETRAKKMKVPPPRSFTYAIFRAVFDSRSSFFAPKPHGNACYVGEIFPQKGAGSDFPPVGRSGNGKIQIYVSFLMSDSYLSNKKLNPIDFFANLIWQVFHYMQRQQNGQRFWFNNERKRLSLILSTFWPVGSFFRQFLCYIVMGILYPWSLI